MKITFKLMFAWMMIIAMSACSATGTDNGSDSTQGSVKFGMKEVTKVAQNVLFSGTSEEPKKVSLTYRTSGGTTETSAEFDLVAFGTGETAGFVSNDVLSLNAGDYEVTKFEILNADGTAIYATPATNSTRDTILNINTSLPYSFSVVAGDMVEVEMEVAKIDEGDIPEDFGYRGFTYDEVKYNIFYIDVLAFDINDADGDGTKMSRASASLTVENAAAETIRTVELASVINKVMVAISTNYTLTISKDGYTPVDSSFTEAELQEYNAKPLVVKLYKP